MDQVIALIEKSIEELQNNINVCDEAIELLEKAKELLEDFNQDNEMEDSVKQKNL